MFQIFVKISDTTISSTDEPNYFPSVQKSVLANDFCFSFLLYFPNNLRLGFFLLSSEKNKKKYVGIYSYREGFNSLPEESSSVIVKM